LPGGPFAGLPDLETGVWVGIGIGLLFAFVAFSVLALWLGTRGRMMAIRSVATGNAAFSETWAATAAPGIALFKFHLALAGIGLVVALPLVGGFALVLLPFMRGTAELTELWPALLALGGLGLVALIPFSIVGELTKSFVSPIMLKEGVGARDAWKRFWPVAKEHLGGLVLYFVLRVVFWIGATIVGTLAGFITCCIGFLPVLHQTIMAPWYVFERAWALEVLASLGPEFDLMVRAPDPSGFGGPGGGYGGPVYPGGYYPPAGGGGGYGPPGGGGYGPPGGGGYGPPGGGGYGPPGGGGYGPPGGGTGPRGAEGMARRSDADDSVAS
jgi:hypothetical protein